LQTLLLRKSELVENLVLIQSQPALSLYSGSLVNLENEFKKFVHIKPRKESEIFNTKTNVVCHPQNRQEIVNKLFDMIDIFECTAKAISPFVFILLVMATVELVATVSAVVVIGHQGVFLINDIFILIKVGVHLCLLQVGHRIQSTVSIVLKFIL